MVQPPDVRRLNALVEHVVDPMVEVDGTGLLTFVNPAFLSVAGASLEAAIGRSLWDWVHPDDLPATLQAFESSVASRAPRTVRLRLRGAGGVWHAYSVTGTMLDNENNELRGVAVFRLIADVDPLREALAQVSGVLDAIPVPAVVLDDQQNVLSLNRAARSLVRPASAVTERPVIVFAIEAMGAEGAAALVDALPPMIALAAAEDRSVTQAVRYSRDGAPRVLRVDVSTTSIGEAPRYVVTLADATQEALAAERRLQMLESLRSQEALLRESQRIARLGNWTLDLTTNVLTWSDEIFRIFEIDRERFGASYEAFLAAIHPDDVARVDAAYTGSLKDRQPYLITHRLLMADGRVKWVEERAESDFAADGTPLVSRGTVQDITEQVLLREEAERSAQQLARIVEASPLPIVMTDESGTILATNTATERTFGWASSDLEGQNVAILTADIPADQHDGFIRHYLETGQASTPEGLVVGRTRDVRARRSDGTVFPAELTVAEIVLPDGRRQFIGILMDRTEWRAKEEQIIRMQKLDAVGTLIAGVSHDFNNLLTAIIGGIDMAIAHPGEARWPALAREAAGRAADLAQGLLRFSRDDEPQRAAVAPTVILDAVVRMMREALDRRIWVSAEAADGLPDLFADRGQVEQVLLNLLVNARDTVIERMTQSGGDYRPSVRISVNERERKGARGVLFSVEDNGMGMPDAVRQRAFDPFFTTKPPGQGTGLGLSIVNGIVTAHDGVLDIITAPGSGTTITIWLPAAVEEPSDVVAPAAGVAEPATTDAGASSASRGRVLVVDDEPMIGEIARAYLMTAGFEVILRGSGSEAITVAERERFDLAIIDLNMPPPDGWAVLEALLQHDPTLPVVIATGYGSNSEVIERGGAAMVNKPYTREVLVRTVEQLIRARP